MELKADSADTMELMVQCMVVNIGVLEADYIDIVVLKATIVDIMALKVNYINIEMAMVNFINIVALVVVVDIKLSVGLVKVIIEELRLQIYHALLHYCLLDFKYVS